MRKRLALATRRGGAAGSTNARATKFFDDGSQSLFAGQRTGIGEPPVPVFHDGVRVRSRARFNTVETCARVPGTRSYPLTAVNLVANFHYRLTYQKARGGSAPLGTSVIATPSYRTARGLALIPTATRSEVSTGTPERYRVATFGQFAAGAQVTSRSAFLNTVIGESSAMLTVSFASPAEIRLAAGAPFVGNDRFRLLTLSSMFSSATRYDANRLRYRGMDGVIRTFEFSGATPRAAHLFAEPVDLGSSLGSWFELIKTPGSTWFPASPSVRVTIIDAAGFRLGLQGFLAATRNPDHDSLSVWLEWTEAPSVIRAGTAFTARYTLTASGGAPGTKSIAGPETIAASPLTTAATP